MTRRSQNRPKPLGVRTKAASGEVVVKQGDVRILPPKKGRPLGEPPTSQQRALIERLARDTGQWVPDLTKMDRASASQLIKDWQKIVLKNRYKRPAA